MRSKAAQRDVTYLSGSPRVVGWLPDSSAIILPAAMVKPDVREMVL